MDMRHAYVPRLWWWNSNCAACEQPKDSLIHTARVVFFDPYAPLPVRVGTEDEDQGAP